MLKALEEDLEKTAHVLYIAKWGIFEVHHNILGKKYRRARVDQDLHILQSHWGLGVYFMSYSICHCRRPRKHLEIVAAKRCHNMLTVNETTFLVAPIECLHSMYFQHHDLMLPKYYLDVIIS